MVDNLKAKLGRKFQKWRKTQCVGCVGVWGDCEMFEAAERRNILPFEFEMIRRGQCPRRTNGTFFVYRDESGTEIKDLNVSDQCPRIVGQAFAAQISSYCEEHSKP